jgi:hypothetical protein
VSLLDSPTTTPTPEPSSFLQLATGLVSFGILLVARHGGQALGGRISP